MTTLLEVEDLEVDIPTESGVVRAVRGVSFGLQPGEVLGVVGESGSGKTMTALAIMGLVPRRAVLRGSVRLDGKELLGASTRELRRLRGGRIAMVFQDPMKALNPMYTVGWQVAETVRIHQKVGWKAAGARAVELLGLVDLPQPATTARRYPHELSGGMRQRVMIAMAIANDPDVIIADEPTTALDVTVQAQLLDMLDVLQAQTQAAMLLVTHDLGVVAGVAERVQVMYAGRIVESGPVDPIFASPQMPYTAGLLASVPVSDAGSDRRRLQPIPGSPPSMLSPPRGCAFAPRCPLVDDRCETAPVLEEVGEGHRAACYRHAEAQSAFGSEPGGEAGGRSVSKQQREPLLVGRGLEKTFAVRGGRRRSRALLRAVRGVDLSLRPGETLGLVGETGCGKSTTARLLLRLEDPDAGSVVLDGVDLTGLSAAALREKRADVQVVFQDPFAALNPRLTVREIVAEPLAIQHIGARRERVRELLEMVGLSWADAARYPHEFSGGQCQRIGIARALALNPKVLILDEPVSALDVSIQASILNLLSELRDELGMAYLFIAHDLSVVRHIADRVAVMYLGRIVESGATDELFANPRHPYTRALLSAVPIPDPRRQRERRRILLTGEVPSPIDPPGGCAFRTRCWKADEICAAEMPHLDEAGSTHSVACHHPEGSQEETRPLEAV